MKYFHAYSANCLEEDHNLTIGITDHESDPIDLVILTRSGQTLYLMTNENDFEFENAIEKVRLHYDELTLTIRPHLVEEVEYSRINIELHIDNQNDLKHALKTMFKHTDVEVQL